MSYGMANKREEFGKIYDKYIEKIYRFVFLKVNSEETAKDLSSEVFIRGWETFKTEKIDNLQAFLYKIARNLVIDHYREKGRTQFVSVEELPLIGPDPGLEQEMALKFDMEQIKAQLSNLKDDYQNVIIWRYLDDLSIPEVAKLLDRSEEATRVLLHRALTSLRNTIKSA